MTNELTTYVVSLKYAPVHKSHCFAFGRQVGRVGQKTVKYIFSSHYKWLIADPASAKVHFIGSSHNVVAIISDCLVFVLWRWLLFLKLFWANRPEYVYFENPHPLNLLVALLAKRCNPHCQILAYVHEPASYKGVHTWMKAAYYKIGELVQRLALLATEHVIVSSRSAEQIMRERYPRYKGSVHVAALLFEDYAAESNVERRYITYVGSIHARRGIRQFVRLVRHCAKNNIALDFQIVTRDDLSAYLSTTQRQALPRLKIINGSRISNEAIACALRESLVCVLLYDFAILQSGVIPVAYMNGTPVVATGLGGLAEVVRSGETGVVVSPDPGNEELLEAVGHIRNNLSAMEKACRSAFEEIFHERNWKNYYDWLMDRRCG